MSPKLLHGVHLPYPRIRDRYQRLLNQYRYRYLGSYPMTRTVQLTLEDDLVAAVDRAAGQRRQSRLAFMRETLRVSLAKLGAQALEQKHRVRVKF